MVGIFFSRFLPFSRKGSSKKKQKENHEGDKAITNPNTILSEQHHEIVQAQDQEFDVNFAFHLQMQEAMSASLALLQPSTLSSSSSSLSQSPLLVRDDVDSRLAVVGAKDVERLETMKPLILNSTSRVRRLIFFVDYFPSFDFGLFRWTSLKITALVSQVLNLQKKTSYCHVTFVAPNAIGLAYKLAREAVVSQITGPAESSSDKTPKETCVICLEETDVGQIFSVDGCLHRYCFSCMKQHVEVKLLHGMLPKCPHEGCKSELNIDICRKFLTPELIEIMDERLKEAYIPATTKVYCPYPRCSALMSKNDLQKPGTYQIAMGKAGARRCTKCSGIFCIKCKVPWHNKMSCSQYKCSNPHPWKEDAKLKSLATRNLWRQCVKCNHMIELAQGCYHITCRCGYEFCYNCGAKREKKRATCKCPVWNEENIIDHEEG